MGARPLAVDGQLHGIRHHGFVREATAEREELCGLFMVKPSGQGLYGGRL